MILSKQQYRLNYFIIFSAAIGGILYGYDIGVISGALLLIKHTIPLSDAQTGLIVGAVLGGGFISNLVTGALADNFGRRRLILLASLIFLCGIGLIVIAHQFIVLLMARLLLGFGVGIVTVAVPLYISEVAPAQIRGIGMNVFQVLLTFGILLAYFVDLIFVKSGNWQAMFLVLLIPTALLFATMLVLPESPRWLIMRHQAVAAAEKILIQTRGKIQAAAELSDIMSSLKAEKNRWTDLLKRQLLLPLGLALSIAVLNQLTGINSIFQYAPLVIHNITGNHSNSSLMQGTVLIGLVNFLTSIVALFFIERTGRKSLLLFGTAVLVICNLMLGVMGSHAHPNATMQILFLLLWVFGFAIGPGVVVWLVFPEVLPNHVRGKGVALCLCFNSLCSAILSSVFLNIIDKFGMGHTFWLLGFFSLLYFVIVYTLLPETKGKTLEQIQRFFNLDRTTA